MTLPRCTKHRGSFLIITISGLSLSCASEKTIPVIEPPAPPPPSVAAQPVPQSPAQPLPRELGKLPEMQMPRFGVSVFALPRGVAGGEAAYAPEWTVAVVNRLEVNHISATPVAQKSTLAQDLEKGTADLAVQPNAKGADILIAGSVAPGGNTQVRLFARDTRDGRLVARSEFEGEESAALQRAVDDAFAQVNRYWFELRRGQFSSTRIEVHALRTEAEVGALFLTVASMPGVQLARHIATTVEASDLAGASFQITFDGDPETLAARLTELKWQSEGKSLHLQRTTGLQFTAVHAD